MNNKKTLKEEIAEKKGTENIEKIELLSHITQNLNKTLRIYQKNALRYYLANFKYQEFNRHHLMFNMATGSGKTLVMAAIILDCYKRGYRNFLFFVDRTYIVAKTRDNFTNNKSAKYLFAENINIDNKKIAINVVDSFEDSKENAINISFKTVQGLYSLFNSEKENAITFENFENRKIVFLADEAHHLNADTKKQTKDEENIKKGWEDIINKAFAANPDNLMFEFTATIPRIDIVLEKYKDKIIADYDLKQFCEEQFSKKIFLLKYENRAINNRFLGAILLNIFRQLVAKKYLPKQHHFKPVMLFKSETIATSEAIQIEFLEYVEKLKVKDIRNFYSFVNADNQGFELLAKSKEFFKEYWGDNFSQNLLEMIQAEINENVCLNVNNDSQAERNQLLLNSLESVENPIRVIFAVDKLNEGWDVLNLFDIVRTKSEESRTIPKATTTKEAQLIGRGARYCPFPFDDGDLYKRKFDNERHPLSALESLSYHTINSVDYINKLNEALEEMGITPEKTAKEITLNLNKKAKKMQKDGIKAISLALNSRSEPLPLLDKPIDNKIKANKIFKGMQIPLIRTNRVEEIEVFSSDEEKKTIFKTFHLKEIPLSIWQKALNQTQTGNLNFQSLHKEFKFSSRTEFFEFVQNETCIVHKSQQTKGREEQLGIAAFILENFQKKWDEEKNKKINYKVFDFEIKHHFELEKRTIWSKNEATSCKEYDWLVYDKCLNDSELEISFLDFIETHKTEIDAVFKNWLVIRNEQYKDLVLYNNDEKSPCYAERFFPDFVFWGEYQSGDKIAIECFMESKGEHLIEKDKWKENLLKSLKGECIQKNNNKIFVEGLCFFRTKAENHAFKDDFWKFIEKYKKNPRSTDYFFQK